MAKSAGEARPRTPGYRDRGRQSIARRIAAGILAVTAIVPTVSACQSTPQQLTNKALRTFETRCTGVGGEILQEPGTYPACYYHAGAYQRHNGSFSATGVSAVFSQNNPKVGRPPLGSGLPPSHSLVQIWAESVQKGKNTGNTIEWGWEKNSGDTAPRLFVNYRVNGQSEALANYGQGTGLVNVGIGAHVGDHVTVGPDGKYAIKLSTKDKAWELVYNDAVIAELPLSLWTSRGTTLNSIGKIGIWGEVAISPGSSQPTQMGTGILATKPGAAYVKDYRLYGTDEVADLSTPFIPTTNYSLDFYGLYIGYGDNKPERYFYYGGGGYYDNGKAAEAGAPISSGR